MRLLFDIFSMSSAKSSYCVTVRLLIRTEIWTLIERNVSTWALFKSPLRLTSTRSQGKLSGTSLRSLEGDFLHVHPYFLLLLHLPFSPFSHDGLDQRRIVLGTSRGWYLRFFLPRPIRIDDDFRRTLMLFMWISAGVLKIRMPLNHSLWQLNVLNYWG